MLWSVTGVLLLMCGAYAFYLIGANILLRTHLLRRLINDGPSSTTVEYSSAYSVVPGLVFVRDLHVRDRDFTTEWIVMLERARMQIGLLDLLHRRFHTTGLRGSGLTIRVRSRLELREATPQALEFLPPIPGFPDPPIREPGEVPARPESPVWKVLLEGIHVDPVREIWVDDYRYAGEAEMAGGMFLDPSISLEVPPTSLDVRAGVLTLRGDPMGGSLAGRLEGRLHPCDLRRAHGDDVLQFLAGSGRVAGKVENVRFLNTILDPPPRLRLNGGTGSLFAELNLDRGHGHGFLEFAAQGVEVAMPDSHLEGAAKGRIVLSGLDMARGLAEFDGSRVEASDVTVRNASGKLRPWWGRMEVGRSELRIEDRPSGRWQALRSDLRVRASDARPLYSLMNTQLPGWAEHLLKMKDLSATADVTLATTSLSVKSLSASDGTFRILGRYEEHGASQRGAFLVEAGPLAVGVGLGEGKTHIKLFRARKWFEAQSG